MTESDTAAAQRLYSILGLTEADIKGILAGMMRRPRSFETRLRKQSDGKSMCAADARQHDSRASKSMSRMARSAD
jgi:hypothetical protein